MILRAVILKVDLLKTEIFNIASALSQQVFVTSWIMSVYYIVEFYIEGIYLLPFKYFILNKGEHGSHPKICFQEQDTS